VVALPVLDAELAEHRGVCLTLYPLGDDFLAQRMGDGFHGLYERAVGRVRVDVADERPVDLHVVDG
jgi:hypothetical protein